MTRKDKKEKEKGKSRNTSKFVSHLQKIKKRRKNLETLLQICFSHL